MDLASIHDLATEVSPVLAAGGLGAPVRQLRLHRLRTPRQVATVQHLREEIDLSVHAAAGPRFLQLEKKETSWASSSASSSTPS